MSEEAPRKKHCYIGVPIYFKLQLACQHIASAWGQNLYVVGSTLQRADWRDIDIVSILPDDEFQQQFPDADMRGGAWEFDPRWLLMCVMLSDWLAHQCGAKVDFKFQPQTWANEHHKGPRNAIGMRISRDRPV